MPRLFFVDDLVLLRLLLFLIITLFLRAFSSDDDEYDDEKGQDAHSKYDADHNGEGVVNSDLRAAGECQGHHESVERNGISCGEMAKGTDGIFIGSKWSKAPCPNSHLVGHLGREDPLGCAVTLLLLGGLTITDFIKLAHLHCVRVLEQRLITLYG